jgi:hypothetical protein
MGGRRCRADGLRRGGTSLDLARRPLGVSPSVHRHHHRRHGHRPGRALQVSSDRYGTIGVAFTYIGWLYVLAFCLLTAAVVGQAIVQDEGAAGRFIRGTVQAAGEPP